MKKSARGNPRRGKRAGSIATAAKWAAGVAVIAVIIYGLSGSTGVAYDEEDIAAIDFSALTDEQRLDALQEANRARCVCGCGMTLAQCVSTDMTCPVRERNIDRIREMARTAAR